jgi:hypothetical protein
VKGGVKGGGVKGGGRAAEYGVGGGAVNGAIEWRGSDGGGWGGG